MIAPRLAQFRASRHLTHAQAAALLGVSVRTYQGWEYGRVPGVALGLLERLLDAWEALEPFASAADDVDADVRDRYEIWEMPCAMAIEVRDLRRARGLGIPTVIVERPVEQRRVRA